MSVPSFIFGGDTGETPDSLKRKRAIAAALLGGATTSAPKNVGEGLNAIGQALAFRIAQNKLGDGEKTQQDKQAGIWEALMGGGGAAPAAGPGAGFSGATGPIADASSASVDIAKATPDLKPAEAEDYAAKYYVSKGLAPYQAAGMVGNLIQESTLNTGARNAGDGRDGSDSIGVGQWNSDRARNLKAFAQGTGRDATNLDAQLDFTLHEMGIGDAKWKDLPGFGSEARAGKLLKNAKDVQEAAAAGISYERPQGWSAANPTAGHGWNNRIGHAQRVASGKWASAEAAPAETQQVQVASADPNFMPEPAVQQPQQAMPDFLTAGLPETARPVEMPAGPLPEAGDKKAGAIMAALAQQEAPAQQPVAAASPVAAALAGQSAPVQPMPAAQEVAANPLPPQATPATAQPAAPSAVAQALSGFSPAVQ